MPRRDLNRREFLAASMTGAAALTLAGCGGAGGAGALLGAGSEGPVDTAEAPFYTLHEHVMRADGDGQMYALDTLGGSLTQLDPGGSTKQRVDDTLLVLEEAGTGIDNHGPDIIS